MGAVDRGVRTCNFELQVWRLSRAPLRVMSAGCARSLSIDISLAGRAVGVEAGRRLSEEVRSAPFVDHHELHGGDESRRSTRTNEEIAAMTNSRPKPTISWRGIAGGQDQARRRHQDRHPNMLVES